MTVSSRDRRALLVLLLVVVIAGLRWGMVLSSGSGRQIRAQRPPTASLLATLALRRSVAAALPEKQKALRRVITELATRENSLIPGDTAPQAQAQLLQVLRNVATQQQPPLEIKQFDLPPPRQFDDEYGEVLVSITIRCTIEQVLNLIADLTAEPDAIATDEISLILANQDLKTLQVRLTVTGLVRLSLITKPRSPKT